MTDRKFRKRIREAVSNEKLQLALERAAVASAKSRAEVFEGLDFEGMSAELRAYKESSLAQVRELFERFRQEAERVGVRVYEAADAAEANRIVDNLAASHGVKKVVKAKSMVTEEVELRQHLMASGVEVTETDLGEWIIQLANERPSHFTVPAVHKTREEIAQLFSEVTGEPVEPDVGALVEVARKQIRRAFIEADMGISGANIAIAETGTLVIVSNEGNARLVTSLPEIHVALVGYEKLVPSIDEATSILKLLSKSGTGQKMTSYVSFITGPSRTSDIEKTLTLGCHGPREVHVIFVDNGRLAAIDDPELREALYCVKCGACLLSCPVYRSVGGHVFGHTYVGGIGGILAAINSGLAEADDVIDLCTTCGMCKSYCPAGIDIPRLILTLRGRLVEAHGKPWVQRLILGALLSHPGRFDAAVKLGRKAQSILLPKSKKIESLPFPLSGLTSFRNLPVLAERPLRERLPGISIPAGKKQGTVAFYPGCVIDYVYPEIGEAVVGVLTRLGWEVRFPKGQGCCGIPALVKGDEDTARSLAKHNINIADFQSSDYVITACPTCLIALREQFARLLDDGSPDAEKAADMASRSRDFSEFLLNVAGVTEAELGNIGRGQRITYHDPCHAKHGMGIFREPRQVLSLAGYEVVEMAEPNACCGFAGSYSMTYPEISESIFKRKLASILSTGASIIASDCPGCLLQLRGGLEKAGCNIRAHHTAEILADVDRVDPASPNPYNSSK